MLRPTRTCGAAFRPTIRRVDPRESIVITKRGEKGPLIFGNAAYRLYAGVAVTVHQDGLSLSLVPPFNIRCPPLFLPFDQMRLEPTSWGLWPEPFAIRMRRATDVDLILDRSVVSWIREHVDREPFGLGV